MLLYEYAKKTPKLSHKYVMQIMKKIKILDSSDWITELILGSCCN